MLPSEGGGGLLLIRVTNSQSPTLRYALKSLSKSLTSSFLPSCCLESSQTEQAGAPWSPEPRSAVPRVYKSGQESEEGRGDMQ